MLFFVVCSREISADPKMTCPLSAKQLPGLCTSLEDALVMPEDLAPGRILLLAGAMSLTMLPVPTVIQQRTLRRAVPPGLPKTCRNKAAQKTFS